MKLKLIAISLSLVSIQFSHAKQAPKDTFRMDDGNSSFSSSCGSAKVKEQNTKAQDKMFDLKSSNSNNFVIRKINQIRINRLQKKLDKSS